MILRGRILLTVILTVILGVAAHARAGETVAYSDGETVLEGYWAPSACSADGPAPTVLIVHQWMGITDHEKSRADRLAALCYNGFAIDMYGRDKRPHTKEQAGPEASRYKGNPRLARHRLQAALDYARARQDTDLDRIAVIGYCFGGSMALELARSGADIKGAASFHGNLSSKAPVTAPGIMTAPLQIHHGAADPFVTEDEITAFREEMKLAGADWTMTYYADAVHGFTQKDAGTDSASGVAYHEKADRRSWDALLSFLREVLK